MLKIVLNCGYGGYGLGVADEFEDLVDRFEDARGAVELVEFVENHPQECGDLEVVELPDEVTDWIINEYDGLETVYYVVNGKIYRK